MFTGLIEEIGKIKSINRMGGGITITVSATKILSDVKVDDSIAINGVCQTVTAHDSTSFQVTAVEETLAKTTLGSLRAGSAVNLERAMKLSDRLGGHIVQGHVDTKGRISNIQKLSTAVMLTVSFPAEFTKYLVRSGSICIDGISLTTARVENNTFTVAVIPHSWESTTLSQRKTGDEVNLEFDILGKYVERLLGYSGNGPTSKSLDYLIDQPEF